MRPEHRFAARCGMITGAALVMMLLPAPAILRMVFALPLVFVLPGLTMLRALNVRFTPTAHGPLVVGLSMAITVLSGLALNWLGGLTPFGWAAWLGGLSILLALAPQPVRDTAGRAPRPPMRTRHGAMLAAAAAVLVLTVHGTLRATAAYRPFPHTSFWMLPMAQASDVYVIGIENDEGHPENYAVQLMVDQRLTGQWQNLLLAPGQTETYLATVQPGAAAEAWLYRAERPDTIYRRVTVAGDGTADPAANTDPLGAGQ
jgi:hypothetical protein